MDLIILHLWHKTRWVHLTMAVRLNQNGKSSYRFGICNYWILVYLHRWRSRWTNCGQFRASRASDLSVNCRHPPSRTVSTHGAPKRERSCWDQGPPWDRSCGDQGPPWDHGPPLPQTSLTSILLTALSTSTFSSKLKIVLNSICFKLNNVDPIIFQIILKHYF